MTTEALELLLEGKGDTLALVSLGSWYLVRESRVERWREIERWRGRKLREGGGGHKRTDSAIFSVAV